jgi:hypothetical protein
MKITTTVDVVGVKVVADMMEEGLALTTVE